MSAVKELKNRYRYPGLLIRRLALANFKLRYHGSILGYLWSFLKPLAIFSILYLIFVHFLRFGLELEHFALYLLLGVVFWNFFLETTTSSLRAIVDHGDLIRKINFPKYTIPVAASVSAAINLGLNLVVVVVFMAVTGVGFSWWLLLMPLVLLELYLIGLTLGLFLASFYVRFRDINHIWEIAAQGLFYITPIIYPLSLVSEAVGRGLLLNPLAQVIQDGRYLMITQDSPTISGLYSHWGPRLGLIGLVLVGLVLAGCYFRHQSSHFAEII